MAKAHTLVDNFNDNALDFYVRWSSASGLAREVNGRIEIPLPSGYSGTGWGEIWSQNAYDLTNSEIRIELVRAPVPHPQIVTYLMVTNGSGSYLKFALHNGMLVATPIVNYVTTSITAVTYDPAVHRWLRLREANGMVYYETSPDGDAWTTLSSAPDPFDLSSVWVVFGSAVYQPVASPGMAIFDNFNTSDCGNPRRVEERRLSARDVRVHAAEVAAARRHDEHANNNDEVNYPERLLAGSYSKSLKHDALGDPDPGSYSTLLRALQSEDPGDFEEIILASSTALKLTNPQSGLAFDIAGPDAQERTMPPAPRFDSEVAAHEMGELYWMAVLRDLAFVNYATDGNASAAVTSLNNEFPRFGGTVR